MENEQIWVRKPDIEAIERRSESNMLTYVGIKLTEVGRDFLRGTMPVDHRTHQPYGILHGGASVVLAETLGSVGGNHCVGEGLICVGLDINSNHIRAVSEGIVIGTARPFHLGKSTQVWHVEIHTEEGKLVNVSRLTLAVVEKSKFSRP